MNDFEAPMKLFSNSPKFLSSKLAYNILKTLFAKKYVLFNTCSLRSRQQNKTEQQKNIEASCQMHASIAIPFEINPSS